MKKVSSFKGFASCFLEPILSIIKATNNSMENITLNFKKELKLLHIKASIDKKLTIEPNKRQKNEVHDHDIKISYIILLFRRTELTRHHNSMLPHKLFRTFYSK
ncbi:uncharacterized protein PRCAT00005737001 [Priceomyces carsonii]|uniref:uncharacterized protein n=1 Tax=Priceomyces carsonii TaxID=28549 RepID=UPI002ED8E7EB|nr:unnamed protein product [Priceomyces carsonii]